MALPVWPLKEKNQTLHASCRCLHSHQQAAQCSKRTAIGTSFGYASKGPSNATLYLADDDASSCSDTVVTGSAAVGCASSRASGNAANELRFRLTVPNTHM
jgi:hypothetical protein